MGARHFTSTPYSEITLGEPKETVPLEMRHLNPESPTKLVKRGFNVVVEKGAGVAASFNDTAYEAAVAKTPTRRPPSAPRW